MLTLFNGTWVVDIPGVPGNKRTGGVVLGGIIAPIFFNYRVKILDALPT